MGSQVRKLAVVVFGAAVVLAACEDPPPQLVLEVTTFADGGAVTAGDGVCEMTAGAGDCSLRAAIEEANAHLEGKATVVVPSGTYTLGSGALVVDPVAGPVAVEGQAPGVRIDASEATNGLDVRGGDVVVRGLAVSGASEAGVVVGDGATVVFGKGALVDNDGPGVLVSAGGRFAATDTTSSGNGGAGMSAGPAAVVEGTYLTVTDNASGGLIGDGAMSLRASVVADNGDDDCAAAVASGGYNLDSDGTCGFADTGDVSSANAGLAPLSAALVPLHAPQAGSPLLGAVPAGTEPCESLPHARTDQRWLERPQGSGCDRGAVEVGVGTLSLTVDAAHDARSLNPGDGVCDDGAGACTLRAAIDEANAWPDETVVTIADGVDPTLSLPGAGEDGNATGDLDIHGDLRIEGGSATLDAAGLDRAIQHHSGDLRIEDLTVRGGRTTSPVHGGGIASSGGSLELHRVTMVDNRAQTANSRGGALYLANESTVVTDSTFVNNRATSFTGAGGAIAVAGADLAVTNSTFSGNLGWFGSAVHHADGAVSLTYVTIEDHGGANVLFRSGSDADAVVVSASIIDGTGALSACNTAVASGTSNVVTDTSCALDATGDLQSAAQTGLEPLAGNGGPTLTHLPTQFSPANDRVPDGLPGLCDGTVAVDQRGEARPQGNGCTAGAVETDGAAMSRLFVVDAAHDAPDANPGDGVCDDGTGACTLRAAIDEANAVPTADTIEIGPGINPTLTRPIPSADLWFEEDNTNAFGDLDVHGSLTILGGGATLTQTRADRVIDHHEGVLVVEELTVTGGSTGALIGESNYGPEGAGIRARADLVVRDSTVSGNHNDGFAEIAVDPYNAGGFGGGLHVEHAAASIERSTVSDNVAVGGGGGGLSAFDATVHLIDSTVTGNRAADGGDVNFSTRGGGVYVGGSQLTIENSSVVDNHARRGGGLFVSSTSSATVTNSTFSANVLLSTGGTVTRGSAVEAEGPVSLVATTVVGNVGAPSLAGYGITMAASLVQAAALPVCQVAATSGGYNVVSDVSCGLGSTGDVEGAAFFVDALADNGGPTLTHLPAASNPAVEAIPVGTSELCDDTLPTDQRGVARPGATGCTIGSVEGAGSGPDPVPLDLVVDAAHDAPDANPGDGVCDDGTGVCTLRAAIDEANLHPGSAITINPGVDPTLTIGGAAENNNAGGDLDVHATTTIVGNGATITQTQQDRVIDHHSGALVLENLTVTGGYRQWSDPLGGGVKSVASLHLVDVIVRDNELRGDVDQEWDLYVYAFGAGVYSSGVLLMERSSVVDNVAWDWPGGSESAGNGGGVYVSGPSATVVDSIVSGNHSDMLGGAISKTGSGTLVVEDSVIEDNSADLWGGGLYVNGGTTVIGGSTLSGNSAGHQGGAVYANNAPVQVSGSTLAANSASSAGGSSHHGGGAIYSRLNDVTLVNSTLSANTGPSGSAIRHWGATGTVTLTLTTVVGADASLLVNAARLTTAGTVLSTPGAVCSHAATSGGYNVVSDDSCSVAATGDVQSVAALLGPLADNGGPTLTHLPWADSPLLEAIPLGTAGLCDGAIPTDQRGVTRPGAAGCSVGSVEGASTDPAP
ncbi:MAG: right-handed parallel beta-helix repeat-containing protein [Acidimicrobiia bacterium]|nr:right-handed parallel beta-helix repeat-containing protein [Acidimicrobiia bacterium]